MEAQSIVSDTALQEQRSRRSLVSFSSLTRCSIFFLDLGGEAAAVELEGDGVAEPNLGGIAEDGSVGAGGDGVAAFEDAQGAAFLKLEK